MSPLSSHNRYPPYPEPQPLPHFDGPAFSCFFVLTAAPEHVTACDCHIWSATLAICDGCDQRAFGKCVSPPCREATWRPTKRCLKTKIKTQNCGANSCLSVLLEKKCTHVQCKMMCPLLIGWFQTTCFPKQQALKSAWELRANPQIDYRTSKGANDRFLSAWLTYEQNNLLIMLILMLILHIQTANCEQNHPWDPSWSGICRRSLAKSKALCKSCSKSRLMVQTYIADIAFKQILTSYF